MDALTHLIHTVFDEHLTLSPETFNGLSVKDQFVQYNLLRFELRFRILPGGGSDTDKILKEIDQKLSDVLFG